VVIAFIRELGYRKVCARWVLKTPTAQNSICAELVQHGEKDRDADKKTINGMASSDVTMQKNSRCKFLWVKSWVVSSERVTESC
jgi:hypothetical protein